MIRNSSRWADKVIQKAIFKYALNCLPISFSVGGFTSGPCPFRFFNTQCYHMGLLFVVKEEHGRFGDLDDNLWVQLKGVNGLVKGWQQKQYYTNERRI